MRINGIGILQAKKFSLPVTSVKELNETQSTGSSRDSHHWLNLQKGQGVNASFIVTLY